MSTSATGIGGTSGGIGYCLCPGVAVPPTLLIAEMGSGALLLQGWQVGPSAYVCAADAGPLREALAAAFGNDLRNVDRSAAVQE